jgi:RNA polymerase sigma-70 factor (ECF subfamily)
MEDALIIDLYWQRQERAIEETDRKYGSYCTKVADNILHDRQDAEECVSDTWLRAWNSMPPERPSILRAFLARITRNLSLDRWRSAHAAKRGQGETVHVLLDELAECIADTEHVEDLVIAGELAGSIGRFVRGLPERDGDLFTRRYFFAESIPEIASRSHLSENNVTVILSRTRKRLRAHLEREGFIL